MRKILLTLILIIGLININAQTIPKDKQLHLIVGSTFGAWCYTVGYCYYPEKRWVPTIVGIGSATLLGVGKETWDKLHGNPFDAHDLAFTVAGGVISVGIIEGVRAIVRRHDKRHHPERIQIFK